jgi:hypothetical protein
VIWDTVQDGLCVLISRGPKEKRQATVTFRVCFYLRSLPGKPQYIKLGRYPDDTYVYPYKDDRGRNIVINCSDIAAVRRAASDIRNRAATLGIDPRRPIASDVFEDVVKEFLEHAKTKNLSYDETERIFKRYVLPEWKNLRMGDIDRDRVTALLDKIEKQQIIYRKDDRKIVRDKNNKAVLLGSPKTATATLAQLSAFFNRHATRTKNFTSPIVKGMGRGKPKERSRVLNDDELRTLWSLLDDTYGACVKAALLTAQRFHKVSSMRRSELKDHMVIPSHTDEDGNFIDELRIDDVWDAGSDDDPDNKLVSAVPLSPLVRDVIASVPVIDVERGRDYVFSVNGRDDQGLEQV